MLGRRDLLKLLAITPVSAGVINKPPQKELLVEKEPELHTIIAPHYIVYEIRNHQFSYTVLRAQTTWQDEVYGLEYLLTDQQRHAAVVDPAPFMVERVVEYLSQAIVKKGGPCLTTRIRTYSVDASGVRTVKHE